MNEGENRNIVRCFVDLHIAKNAKQHQPAFLIYLIIYCSCYTMGINGQNVKEKDSKLIK